MIAFSIPNIIGSIVLICVAPTPSTKGGLVAAFYCMQVFQAVRSLSGIRMSGLMKAEQPCYLCYVIEELSRANQTEYHLCRNLFVILDSLEPASY